MGLLFGVVELFLSNKNKNTFYKPVRSNTHTYTPYNAA